MWRIRGGQMAFQTLRPFAFGRRAGWKERVGADRNSLAEGLRGRRINGTVDERLGAQVFERPNPKPPLSLVQLHYGLRLCGPGSKRPL